MDKKKFEEKWVGLSGLPTSNKNISLYGTDVDKLWQWVEQQLKQSFECGYELGHNDTVESCYGDIEEKAEDYIKEINKCQ